MDKLTFSALRQFRNCRRKYRNRYELNLVPIKQEDGDALTIGSVFHAALEEWYKVAHISPPQHIIDAAYTNRDIDADQKRLWHINTAMMRAYCLRYPDENWYTIAVEDEFCERLSNPTTGAPSRSFNMAGKVDMVIRFDRALWIVEHKSAGQITGDYIDRLPLDTQIALYSHYVGNRYGERIIGVIYNVVEKPKLRQSIGETEDEYQARCADLIAKSKTGKTTAKRKEPESDDDFQTRLSDWYASGNRFHRETLYLSQDDIRETLEEAWELSQQILQSRREGTWWKNTDQCTSFGRPCPYMPLCKSHDSPMLVENMYTTRAPHEELSADPIF